METMKDALRWDDCEGVETHPHTWPVFGDDEVAAAVRVLRSGKVNAWVGEETSSFEREYAAFTGSRHAIAVANGTVALELALRALGIGEGDDVITSPRTYIASASCAVRRAAPLLWGRGPSSRMSTWPVRISPRRRFVLR
jgi:dTDP-4-amino-4,6-dideoxygalactose transaminase